MQLKLTQFNIFGLHGDMDIKISITDNRLVIVAENGLGKTTIVNIIYYTLSRQWYKLTEYHFESITFILNDKEHSIRREELNDFIRLRKLRGRSRRLGQSPRMARVADYILDTYSIADLSELA